MSVFFVFSALAVSGDFWGTLHWFYVRGAMPDQCVTGFFLSAQLVVERVEESVRESASWVF